MTNYKLSTLAADMLEAAVSAASSDTDTLPYLSMRLSLAAALDLLVDSLIPENEDVGMPPMFAETLSDEQREKLSADAKSCRAQRMVTRQAITAIAEEYKETEALSSEE